jgi:antitoxin component YwqK of YwqJK toxin-antitoxin module
MKHILLVLFIMTLSLCKTHAQTTEVIIKYDNGKVYQTGFYNENNERDSLWTTYNENGVIVEQGYYFIGNKDGVWKSYNDEGRKVFQVVYHNGKKCKGKQWDEHGHLIDKRQWNEDGKLICETRYAY